MARHERLELAHHVAMEAEREIGLDSSLESREMQLLEARDRRRREVLEGNVHERLATPQAKGLAERLGCSRGLGLVRLGDELLEPVDVELLPAHLDRVSGGTRDDQPTARPERLPQMRDTDLQSGRPRRRRPFRPERIEQTVGTDDLVGMQEQHRQERAKPGPGEANGLPAVPNLERAEDAELHGAILTLGVVRCTHTRGRGKISARVCSTSTTSTSRRKAAESSSAARESAWRR
jgi:hypothetical protein